DDDGEHLSPVVGEERSDCFERDLQAADDQLTEDDDEDRNRGDDRCDRNRPADGDTERNTSVERGTGCDTLGSEDRSDLCKCGLCCADERTTDRNASFECRLEYGTGCGAERTECSADQATNKRSRCPQCVADALADREARFEDFSSD